MWYTPSTVLTVVDTTEHNAHRRGAAPPAVMSLHEPQLLLYLLLLLLLHLFFLLFILPFCSSFSSCFSYSCCLCCCCCFFNFCSILLFLAFFFFFFFSSFNSSWERRLPTIPRHTTRLRFSPDHRQHPISSSPTVFFHEPQLIYCNRDACRRLPTSRVRCCQSAFETEKGSLGTQREISGQWVGRA